ncbi:MAG: methyltransferase domain-containing protein [PVC group bacterium]|nr:methyltransferase domain-containing protein [PVC group bacterium]
MIKQLYAWFHKVIAKADEKDQPSGGVWPNIVRKEVLKMCADKQGKLIAVGCGEGLFISQLGANNPKFSLTGLDNNKIKLEEAKRKCQERGLNVDAIHGDATHMPFSAGYFDTIVCINVVLNLPSIEIVQSIIKEISRVCAVGGRFVFDFRNACNPAVNLKYKLAPYYDETVKRDNLSLNTYTYKDIERILVENNFKIISRKYSGFPCNSFAPIIILEAEKC